MLRMQPQSLPSLLSTGFRPRLSRTQVGEGGAVGEFCRTRTNWDHSCTRIRLQWSFHESWPFYESPSGCRASPACPWRLSFGATCRPHLVAPVAPVAPADVPGCTRHPSTCSRLDTAIRQGKRTPLRTAGSRAHSGASGLGS